MAGDKAKVMWPVLVVVVVAAVFAFLAFRKEKPAPSVSVDVLADKQSPASVEAGSVTIKPTHSSFDQAKVAAVKPVEAVVMPPQQVTPQTTLAVQVYSFKEKARADAALLKLKDKGYKAYIMQSDLGARGIWYRVRVGTFSNEEDAKKALESITQEFKSGIIVTE